MRGRCALLRAGYTAACLKLPPIPPGCIRSEVGKQEEKERRRRGG